MKKIIIYEKLYNDIINHCLRKLNMNYENDETAEQQAFGVIIARENNDNYYVTKTISLKKNYRFDKNISQKMNSMIDKYAIPGELNSCDRAWAADPIEMSQILSNLDDGEKLIGMYHMHHDNSWYGSFPKDIPSKLDVELSKNNGLITFIVYIGKQQKGIRAFYESFVDDEYEIVKEVNCGSNG